MCAILMAMSHQKTPRLKPLLDRVPPGLLVDTQWLKGEGVDAKSIHNYVARGWLERVVRSVYRRPLPTGARSLSALSWESVLLSLQWIMKYDVHLGGVSALDLAGYAHYLPLGGTPPIHLYGDVPTWLKRLPSNASFVVHRRNIFGDNQTGIVDSDRSTEADSQAVSIWPYPLRVSSPERGILEALDEVTDRSGFEPLDKWFESLTMLRPRVLMALLTACRSVKVRRLFFVFADRHGHAWRKHVDAGKIGFGSGPRALVEGGRLHPTYRIYVPEDFIPRSESEADAGA